ncbi:E2f-associated phosphoprotein [Plakobranchus ocellatus]|uniref:E2f-associated phosphoprotein n=1 Tax=Plakobranchus ocellatus TaxID=259542 RepID=A0AAV3YQN3_9GAST|nr:E2f-associated phosphoprotein [Plakobranchus ocellatus]
MSRSLYAKENGYDMFGDDEDSSDNSPSSSEDEIDIILHGTPEQRRKLHLSHQKWKASKNGNIEQRDSSSEDEFEKEMNAELTSHVKFLEKSREIRGDSEVLQTPISHEQSVKRSSMPKPAEEFYDDVYFDSDEEEESSDLQHASNKPRHKVISNDDLLYDPDMDDKDQRWVDKQRQSHRSLASGKIGKKANSDALLDCPACMTTLCIDCQRHETHKHQYRAMFVMNCTVDTSETLECPEQPKKKKKKGKTQSRQQVEESGSNTTNKDLFNPVRCTECSTVVGVYDIDEVYHFFNVLASHT